MSYIGNQVTSVPHIVDIFSGDNSSTIFGVLTRAPAGTAAIAVFVDGAYKRPSFDYTLNGDLITFTVAPPAGSSNIVIHHLGNGTTTQVPSDGSVTSIKIAEEAVTGDKIPINAIRGNNIVAGTITGNLLASQTITGDDMAPDSIRGNNIVAGTITGNLIAETSISANQFSSSANTKILSSGFIGSIIFGA
jgi:hypothetical protein